jgi:hypothetical protein
MGKRNQYNRSTLPGDMNITLYNAAAGQAGPSADFTVNADAGFLAYLPTVGTLTGTIDVSSMKNGQRLDISLPAENGFLLSCSSGGGKLFGAGASFVNTSSLAAGKTYYCYKLDVIDTGTPTYNVLVLAGTSSFPGF